MSTLSAGPCLNVMAEAVADSLVIPCFEARVTSPDWHQREAVVVNILWSRFKHFDFSRYTVAWSSWNVCDVLIVTTQPDVDRRGRGRDNQSSITRSEYFTDNQVTGNHHDTSAIQLVLAPVKKSRLTR